MTQEIRLSQYIITYGPGAILEGLSGPRVILLPNIGLFNQNLKPEDYEISDQRITEGFLPRARIFRLPSNAELGYRSNYYIYRTKPFPSWKLCTNNQLHNGNFNVLYQGDACPVCHNTRIRGIEAIRFILACPHGHMDDVNWNYLVHEDDECNSRWFKWYGGGGSLSNVIIECPICNENKNLGIAYSRPWRCSGRFPERESFEDGPQRPGCNTNAKMIQRQASNLRIPELVTLFSIPPRHTTLHNLLELRPILDNLIGYFPETKEQFAKMLKNLVQKNRLAGSIADEILKYDWTELSQAIQDVLSPIANTYRDLILEEFHALIEGSINGVPPVHGPKPRSPVIFEINPHMIKKFKGPNGTLFRITPINKLRTVTVNTGYRREVNTQVLSEIVNIGFPDVANPEQRWYPGVEFLGEGIFFMRDENNGYQYDLLGDSQHEWIKSIDNMDAYPNHVFRDPAFRDELDPLFVQWHSLSHLLMRAISIESGYSSASIRERIYIENNHNGQRAGILLYATQPGTEGTLGGLIALVPYFQEILNDAFEQLMNCSGDPLCKENKFKSGSSNGAACYSCLLVSETSCEHRNLWLDRNVLLENLP